jgi:hypothetical protein
MVLLVLGVPILVLLVALALAQLETRLLPSRETDPPGRDEALHEPAARSAGPSPNPGDVRCGEPALTSPRGTSNRPSGSPGP